MIALLNTKLLLLRLLLVEEAKHFPNTTHFTNSCGYHHNSYTICSLPKHQYSL